MGITGFEPAGPRRPPTYQAGALTTELYALLSLKRAFSVAVGAHDVALLDLLFHALDRPPLSGGHCADLNLLFPDVVEVQHVVGEGLAAVGTGLSVLHVSEDAAQFLAPAGYCIDYLLSALRVLFVAPLVVLTDAVLAP